MNWCAAPRLRAGAVQRSAGSAHRASADRGGALAVEDRGIGEAFVFMNVAGVGVLGDLAQRDALAAAADHDRRARLLKRSGLDLQRLNPRVLAGELVKGPAPKRP